MRRAFGPESVLACIGRDPSIRLRLLRIGATALRLGVLFLLVASFVACGDSSSTGYGTKGIGEANVRAGRDAGGVLDEADGGTIFGDDDGGGPIANGDSDDTDGDGVPNADDCDPNSKALRTRIVQDDLATDKGLFAAAGGFPTTSWSFDGAAAYRQTRLLDASDVSFYAKDSAIGDVQIEATMASTEVGTFNPKLRQIFVLIGGVSNGGALSATGCGIEVVGGESPEQKTSIVKLEGTTTNVVTTVLQRVTRPAVQANEDLSVKLRFENGAMICDVTQVGQLTTATANGLGALKGSVGFFTRQTKALFKNVRVCGLK